MHVPVKIITGVWENTNVTSPIAFQHIANPTISWKDAVLDDLRNTIRHLNPSKVSIDGYYANAHELILCDTWEQVTNKFYSIRLMLLRDEDKQFTFTFEGKQEKFHLYFKNF